MTAIQLTCCHLDPVIITNGEVTENLLVPCEERATWGFQDGPEPDNRGYACDEHLGSDMNNEHPEPGEPVFDRLCWPLLDGYDATITTREELQAAGVNV